MEKASNNAEIIAAEQKIVLELTGLTDESAIEINDSGWTSRVYIVADGMYVIKFPRRQQVKDEYQQEIAMMGLLQTIETPVKVPRVRWTHPSNEFLGYEGIVGRSFELLEPTADFAIKKRVGHDIGLFLGQIHSLSFDTARTFGIKDEIKQFQVQYELALPLIEAQLTHSEQFDLRSLMLDEMPAEIERLGEDLALCHGDLGYWNIILGENNLIGVIDFGDVGYYDRSKDLIGFEDDNTLDAALAAYGDNQTLRQKIAIRQRVLPLLELPFFIQQNDYEAIQTTLTRIRRSLVSRS